MAKGGWDSQTPVISSNWLSKGTVRVKKRGVESSEDDDCFGQMVTDDGFKYISRATGITGLCFVYCHCHFVSLLGYKG